MSLAYTGLFVLKFASTPLFAYLTEPLPWSVPERTLTTWDSFDAFNNATFSYLASLYNSHTMPDATNVCRFDSATITFVARHVLELPVTSVPSTSSMTYLVQIPGAMFFSPGLLQFVSTFLSANATTRRTSRLSQCQRNYYFGVVSSDSCIWLDPLPVVESSSKDLYMAYYGTYVWEGASWSWFKVTFRCPVMTLFGSTSLMVLFHATWKLFLPSEPHIDTIEIAAGMVTGFFVMAGLPVVYSLAAQQLSKCQPQLFRCMRGSSARLASLGSTIRRKQSDLMSQTMPTAAAVVPKAARLRHPSWVGEINQTYIHSRRSFNDAKNRVLFAIMRRLFALKLASTPMLAYLTEPWPWSVPQMNRVHFDSYDAFNNASFAYLQSIYNNKTMARDAVCRFDSATNSYVLRKRLNLPSTSVPSETFLSYLIQCPGMSNTTHVIFTDDLD
ncbi:hypothetical protein Ae201684P_020493 [Aphanomyces euteiches]|nr:hypothetical protein Ae201684P_020493 [Aphanomyces euteiches]